MESQLDNIEIEFVSIMDDEAKKADHQKKRQEQIDHVLNHVIDDVAPKQQQKEQEQSYPPFIHACVQGQLEMVRFMMSVHGKEKLLSQVDEKGRTALQCMQEDVSEEQQNDVIMTVIMDLLKDDDDSNEPHTKRAKK